MVGSFWLELGEWWALSVSHDAVTCTCDDGFSGVGVAAVEPRSETRGTERTSRDTIDMMVSVYQRRALNAGQCGVEVEGGRLPTQDWMLNLQILTSGGFR